MKRFFFFTGLCFIFFVSNSQVKEDKGPCDDVDVSKRFEAEAYTNSKAWTDHLEKKIQLPDSVEARIPPGTYNVSVRFLIDTNGKVRPVQVLNDPGFGLAKILVDAISSYTGEWKPASQCGRDIKAYRTQAITVLIPQ